MKTISRKKHKNRVVHLVSYVGILTLAVLLVSVPFLAIKPVSALDANGRASVSIPDPIQNGHIQRVAVGTGGDMYVAYGDSYTLESKLYHFSNTQTLLSSKVITYCEPLAPQQDRFYVSSMTIDEAGSLYISVEAYDTENVSNSAESCIQKYTANGDRIEGFDSDIDGPNNLVSNLFSDHSGKIYAGLYKQIGAESSLEILNQDGQSVGVMDSQAPDGSILQTAGSTMATYNDELYVTNRYGNGEVYVFSRDGSYLRTIDTGTAFEYVTVDMYGRIFTILSNRNNGVAYYNGSLQNISGIAPDNVPVYAFTSSVNAQYWAGYDPSSASNTVYMARPIVAPQYAPILEVSNINDSSAHLSIMVNSQELPLTDATISYQLTNSVTDEVTSGTVPYNGESVEIQLDSLDSGTMYTYSVQLGNVAGNQGEQGSFTTTGSVPQPTVEAAVPTIDSGKKILIVNGSRFGDYLPALSQSLVTLNNTSLPFCSDGTGATAEQIINGNGLSADLVSDTPACYWIIKNEFSYSMNSVVIWLPDTFDTTAQGTVSVNHSPVYTFNQGNGNESPIEPSAYVTGDKPLDQHPTVPALPTFSGRAEPGATVKVTVYSDPITCTTIADSNGNWACTLPTSLPVGEHTVYVRVTNPDSSIEDLGPYAVVVAGSTITNTTPLAPNTGFLKATQAFKEIKEESQRMAIILSVGVAVFVSVVGGVILYAVTSRKKRQSF